LKQVIQNMKNGLLEVAEVPAPPLAPGMVSVRNVASAISAGTERMTVELAQKSLAGKAKERPDLVAKVLRKLKQDGLIATFKEVMNRLDRNVALGYSTSGVVDGVGLGVDEFRPGDRVACAGVGYASHAEYITVPKNLVVKIPDGASHVDASLTTIGAIAMHGFRLADVALGETVVVIGLGLVGQFAAQVASAAGLKVIAVDLDREKVDLAIEMGAADAGTAGSAGEVAGVVAERTGGAGADAVLVCAAAKSSQPATLACEIARDRGKVVVVGAVQMELDRNLIYSKELSVTVSRSYGPGRYDTDYEEKGFDYPAGYVRWTERRNLQEVADLIGAGKLKVDPLITHRFSIDDALSAYDLITGKTDERFLGVVLTYPEGRAKGFTVPLADKAARGGGVAGKVGLAVVGAGNFARGTLLPAYQTVGGLELVECVDSNGPNAMSTAKRFAFRQAGSSFEEVIARDDVDVVIITTPHNEHAAQATAALRAGKHVHLEKPVAITEEGVDEVAQAAAESGRAFMVGYNRRFAPATDLLREFFKGRNEPLSMLFRVNAGPLPQGHWVADVSISGGRILGEVCHFVDWMIAMTGALPRTVFAQSLAPGAEGSGGRDDVLSVIRFADESLGTIVYTGGGSGSVEKEYVEVSAAGKTAMIMDFREVRLFSGRDTDVVKYRMQRKGHAEEAAAFIAAVKGWGSGESAAPIPMEELLAVSRATFAMIRSSGSEQPVVL